MQPTPFFDIHMSRLLMHLKQMGIIRKTRAKKERSVTIHKTETLISEAEKKKIQFCYLNRTKTAEFK